VRSPLFAVGAAPPLRAVSRPCCAALSPTGIRQRARPAAPRCKERGQSQGGTPGTRRGHPAPTASGRPPRGCPPGRHRRRDAANVPLRVGQRIGRRGGGRPTAGATTAGTCGGRPLGAHRPSMPADADADVDAVAAAATVPRTHTTSAARVW